MKRKLVAILTLCMVAILSMIGLTACDTSIKATGITLNKTSISLFVGDTDTLTATIAPEDTTDKTITWTTSDDDVATVDDGDILAVGAGTATITATTANGKTATCAVTVQTSAMWFNTMQKDGDTYKKSVGSAVAEFAFAEEIGTRGYTTFAISMNEDGSEALSVTTVALSEGSNVFYVVESLRGEKVAVHKAEIYRLKTFEVKYYANDQLVDTKIVDEGTLADATVVAPELQGYDFAGWEFDFTQAITENVEITAKYDPATDTKYVIEYYLEGIDGVFAIDEDLTEDKEGTTAQEATATPATVNGFTFDEDNADNVVSGTIAADGSLVLKLYYTRNTYAITTSANSAEGSVTLGGEYKFEAQVTLTATANLGYDFVGWFVGEENVGETAEIQITVDGAKEYVAKFQAKAELSAFKFTATADTLVIDGLKDNTAYSAEIPAIATNIAENAFADCTRLVELINRSENFMITNGIGSAMYLVEVVNSATEPSKVSTNEDGFVLLTSGERVYVLGYVGEATDLVLPENTTSIAHLAFEGNETLVSIVLPKVSVISKNAFAGCSAFTTVYFLGTFDDIDEIYIDEENAVLFETTLYAYSESTPTELGKYWHYVDGVITVYSERDIARGILAEKLAKNELASFDEEAYESFFEAQDESKFASLNVEYLESYQGMTGVIKVSGAIAEGTNTGVVKVYLPLAMTMTKEGTAIAGSSTIQDDFGDDVIFNLTDLQIDMFVVSKGEGVFGMFQSKYVVEGVEGEPGWGGKNFDPAIGEWFTHSTNVITADYLRFAVSAGEFEFYLAGIYQGGVADRAKVILAKELGANELANFKSQEYINLLANDPVYGGRGQNPEVGTFFGKDNVIKLGAYSGKIMAPMYLPKDPTGDKITIQMYIVGGAGARVGVYGIKNAGWMNPNHATDYARDQWITLVYTGFADIANADYPMLRFASEPGVEAIYIAGIWDGDQSAYLKDLELAEKKEALAKELSGAELANFDDEAYLDLIEVEKPAQFSNVKIEYLENYNGKTGVIKFSGTTTGGAIRVYLPKAMAVSKTGTVTSGGKVIKVDPDDPSSADRIFDITQLRVEMYVVNPGTSAFGMFQSIYLDNKGMPADAGWGNQNFTPTLNAWFTHSNEKITANHVRFGIGAGEFEFYVAAILGSAKDALAETLGENELANFNHEDYLTLLGQHPVYYGGTGGCVKPNASIVDFGGKTNVLKLADSNASNSQNVKLTLPKSPTQTTITVQVYLVANANDAETPARFGLFKQEGGGWDDTVAGTNHKTDFARGEWLTLIFTEIDNTGAYDFLYICFETNIDEVYIAGIWDGDQREALAK